MKVMLGILLFCILLSAKSQVPNSWTRKADVPGIKRFTAVSFSTDSFGYVILGGTGSSNDTNDLWRYNPRTDSWKSCSAFPGGNREDAMAFMIGEKVYVGLGDNRSMPFNDVWEYNTTSDIWTRKADFPGHSQSGTTAFSLNDKGYVCLGYSVLSATNPANEVWEFKSDSNIWVRKSDFPTVGTLTGWRVHSTGLIINGQAFVGLGSINGVQSLNDFWKYDPIADTWSQKTNFPGSSRDGAFGFTIGGKGYIGAGFRDSVSICVKDFYQYNADLNTWNLKDSFQGEPRAYSIAFSLDGKGYVGTGWDVGIPLNDFWQYTPDSIYTGIRDADISSLTISPIPAAYRLALNTTLTDFTISISDVSGRIFILPRFDREIDISSLAAGVYCLHIRNRDGSVVRRFVKE